MMKAFRIRPLLAALPPVALAALMALAAVRGVPPVLAQTPSPVAVGVVVEPTSVTVGEVFTITLSASHPPDYHVIFPNPPDRTDDGFEIRSRRPVAAVDNGDGTLTSSVIMEAALFRVGEHSTPALSVGARGPDGGDVVYRPARPVSITVESVLDASAGGVGGQAMIPPIAPQSEMSSPPIWPWFAAGAMAMAIIAFFARRYWLGGNPPAPPLGAPAEIALAELDRIERLDLPAVGEFSRHYTLVSDCLRAFLNGQFGVPTMERATSEIAAEFRAAAAPESEISAAMAVLEESDLVKFARLSPEPSDAREAVSASRRTVRDLSARLAEPPASADGANGARERNPEGAR